MARKGGEEASLKHYVSKEVVCPFYRQEDGLRLYCEGFDPCCSLQVSFSGRDVMRSHKHRHCNSFRGYPECPLYPAINGQYE